MLLDKMEEGYGERVVYISHYIHLPLMFLQISWIRRRDWHILTTGKTTYTNDERFHVLHADGSDEWTLQIKFVQKRDNGTYECQVRQFCYSFM